MNDYTLFGEFVNGLEEHLDLQGVRFSIHTLAELIMGPTNDYQTSRFLRGKTSYHKQHKGAIRQILENGTGEHDAAFMQRIAEKGHKLVAERWDDKLVQVLPKAIDKARGQILTDELLKHPLTPSCEFCQRMYGLYNRYYGVTELESTDLERFIRSSVGVSGPESLTIYNRLLLATLLGPEAIPTMAKYSQTAVFGEELLSERVDGFELSQLVLMGNEFIDENVCGFGRGVEVLIGRGYNTDTSYVPAVDTAEESRISYEHAVIRPSYASNTYSWELVNLSVSNGTAVWRVGEDPMYSRRRGEVMPLRNGDEIWIAPVSNNGSILPECTRGALLRFEIVTSFTSTVEGVQPSIGATPTYGERVSGICREIYGFALKDVAADSDWQNYSFADIEYEDDYFSLPIGRLGGFEVSTGLVSAVSGRHAVIEPGTDDGRVSLTNHSNKNDIVVSGASGVHTLKAGVPGEVILANNDAILLAGVVDNGKPHVQKDGAVVKLRYLFRSKEPRAQLKPDVDCSYYSLFVKPGATIGRKREGFGEVPQIELPENDDFYYVSRIHGRFDYQDGVWTYTHLGRNDTCVIQVDGSLQSLTQPQSTTVLTDGCKLSFATSPIIYEFVTNVG